MWEGRGGGGISDLDLAKGTAETEIERARGLPGGIDDEDLEFVLERLLCRTRVIPFWKALGGELLGAWSSSSSAIASTFRTDGLRGICPFLAFREALEPPF